MANRQNTLLLKRSNIIGKIPPVSGLTLGEMALNTADAILYSLFTSGTTGGTEVREIGWNRIHRTGDTVTGDFTFYGDIKISGSSQPNGYALSVTGDTSLSGSSYQVGNFNITGNTNQLGNISLSGNASLYNLSAITITFDTTYTGTTPYGVMAWDPNFGVPQVGMVGGNVVQKIGESVYAYVKNGDTTPLTKGEVVYIFGASGDKMTVKRASASGDTTSSKTLGVVAEPIGVGQLGYVITQGTLDGLNLGSYTAGDIVWLSTVAGQFTNVKRYAPTHLVFIGVVQRANNGNGQLYVKPQNGYEMEELHDVMSTGATYGDILVYSAYNGYNVWASTKTLTGNYTISGNTTQTGNFNITGNTVQSGSTTQVGSLFITGNTTQIGNYHITGNTSQIGNSIMSGNTFITGNTSQIGDVSQIGNYFITGDTEQIGNQYITGNTEQIGNVYLTGNTEQIGDFNITGNTVQSGSTTQVGNVLLTGNTNQLGYLYIVSATTGCTLAVTGNTCLDGDLDISGNTFMSGNFCMNNMNSTGQTGTNCLDTSLIPTGTTIIHQFQSEGGVLAHLGDLATGEPNSRGFTYFENNATNTSFVASGTGVYTEVIGAPTTFQPYNNLFVVTTGATTATTNKMTYNYPPATGTSTATYLKFTVSVTIQNAQNQQLTFQVRRNRSNVFSFLPIGMSITPQSNNVQGITFNGISEAINNDEFVVVVKNDTGSNPTNSIRVVDMSFSMFT